MAIEYRSIRFSEFDECLDLWDRAFAHTPRDFFVPYFYNDPDFKPEYTRVCLVDGKMVSAVQICERWIKVGDVMIVMGGIGNVGTDPEHRGQGYSTRLLQDSIDVMNQAGMYFSELYTGIYPFYERLGWHAIPHRFYTGQLKESLDIVESECHLRPCNWDEDIDAIISIYDDFNNSRSHTTIRSREYWMEWIKIRSGSGASFMVADGEGGVSGYIQCNHDEENIWLREIGYRLEDCATAERLINGAILDAHSKGVRKLWSYLPDESEIAAVVTGNTDLYEAKYSSGAMYRIINVESMMNKLQPELSQRLISAGITSCVLTIDIDGNMYEAPIQGFDSKKPVGINLNWCDLLSLLFNLNDTQPDIDGKTKPILDILFPKQHSASWSLDHF